MALLLFTTLLAPVASAAEAPLPEPTTQEATVGAGRPMRNAGRGLVIGGAVQLGVGAGLLGGLFFLPERDPSEPPRALPLAAVGLYLGGAGLTLLSLPALVTGGVLWGLGTTRMNKAKRRPVSLVPVAGRSPGLTLTGRF